MENELFWEEFIHTGDPVSYLLYKNSLSELI